MPWGRARDFMRRWTSLRCNVNTPVGAQPCIRYSQLAPLPPGIWCFFPPSIVVLSLGMPPAPPGTPSVPPPFAPFVSSFVSSLCNTPGLCAHLPLAVRPGACGVEGEEGPPQRRLCRHKTPAGGSRHHCCGSGAQCEEHEENDAGRGPTVEAESPGNCDDSGHQDVLGQDVKMRESVRASK